MIDRLGGIVLALLLHWREVQERVFDHCRELSDHLVRPHKSRLIRRVKERCMERGAFGGVSDEVIRNAYHELPFVELRDLHTRAI